ncbi:MAG: DNA mismatch repair protein MutS, partial [bacterium]|nr:DNA mismatch repair protein MutS [bacterium]
MDNKKLTPMLKQYFEIKKDYPDAILFFRMGDFYEMFFEDAKLAAPVLEVVLTSRDKKKEDAVPLCGIPHHARDNYAAKLLKNGFKVAICEQVEDPALAKGLVKREVTRVLTPATALEIESVDSELNNFIVSIYKDSRSISIASIDLSVSDFEVKYFDTKDMDSFSNEFFRKFPREIIIHEDFQEEMTKILEQFPELPNTLINQYDTFEYNYFECENVLKNQLNLSTIEGLGLKGYDSAVIASAVLIKYLKSIRKTAIKNISTLRFAPNENYLILDSVSFRNLEIQKNLRTGTTKGSLFGAVDFTITPMGKRLLKKWLTYPLIDKERIEKRHDGVDEFSQNLIARSEIRKLLKGFGDLAKLNSKISLNIALPSHLLALKDTLKLVPDVHKEIESLSSAVVGAIHSDLDPLPTVVRSIEQAISNDPSNNLNLGNYIKTGYHEELDELRSISRNAKEVISAMEKSEKEKSGIATLKIKYNKVFGYFIEITKTHLKLVPPHYIRKQTLVNAERFITDELKVLEEKILKAEERIVQIEKTLYAEVVEAIQEFAPQLNTNSYLIALLDVISAGGELSQRKNYIRSTISKKDVMNILDARLPVVEIGPPKGFIPNDAYLNSRSDQVLII